MPLPPRGHLVNPATFGTSHPSGESEWRNDTPRPAASAAHFQHRASISIQRAMRAKGMSQDTLGRKIGVDRSHISRMLNGRVRMSLELTSAISIALDIGDCSMLLGKHTRTIPPDAASQKGKSTRLR